MILVLILPTPTIHFLIMLVLKTLLMELKDLQGFPATVSSIFQGLSIPGKCH